MENHDAIDVRSSATEVLIQYIRKTVDAQCCTITLLPKEADTHARVWFTHPPQDLAVHTLESTQDLVRLPAYPDQIDLFNGAFPSGPQAVSARPYRAMASMASATESDVIVIYVYGSVNEDGFNEFQLELLRLITPFVGVAANANRLKDRFNCEFFAPSLGGQNGANSIPLFHENQVEMKRAAKIIARSFCRRMTRAGFNTAQIIHATSEIIAELSKNLKHRN